MTPKAIRLKHWAKIYSARWRLDYGDLLSEVYGPDVLPLPTELRNRVELLHEIAKALDQLTPRDDQWEYWRMPLPNGLAPQDLLRCSWPNGCLMVILDDLLQKVVFMEIAQRKVGCDPDAIVRFLEETIALGSKSRH